MKLILKKFPRFKIVWQAHVDWWDGKPAGLCNDMSAFSDYVLGLLNKNECSQEVQSINFIEELMTQGDQATQEAAATCFLEDLINLAAWGRVSALSFVHLLGEESKKYCKAWDDFTGVKTEGLD